MRVFDLLKSRIDKMEEKRDVNGLILALKDDDEVIRKESAKALGNMGAVEASEPLIQSINDSSQGVKEEAITSLGKIGSMESAPFLIKALGDKQIAVRWRAAQALGNIDSTEAVEPLKKALNDQDMGVREEAITSLGKIGKRESIEPLVNLLNSPHTQIRWRAAQALGRIGDPQAAEPLTQILQDPDQGVREEAITALGRINIKPYLQDLKTDKSMDKEKAVQNIRDNKKVIIPEDGYEPPKMDDSEGISLAENKGNHNDHQPAKSASKNKNLIMGKEIDNTGDLDNKLNNSDEVVKESPPKASNRLSNLNELKNRGYYHFITRFVDKSRYDYQENLVQKTGYNYHKKDLMKLKKLLEYKGMSVTDLELQDIVQREIKEQEYQEFEEKITESSPTNRDKFLEIYTLKYSTDSPQNMEYLTKLLKKHKKSVNNLEEDVVEVREKNQVKEFENKLMQPSFYGPGRGKDSPSILMKFLQKELIEKREKLISTGNYHIIENFVGNAKYDYQIKDLEKLKKLLNTRNMPIQDEELLWIIQEEIKTQEYNEFEEKIMETHPTTKQHFFEQYIKNYKQDSPSNIINLRKLLLRKKLSSIDLEKEVSQTRQSKEIAEFEQRLLNEDDSPYGSLPVTESSVIKDRALKNAQILTNLGNMFYDLGKMGEALNYYDKAISSYPEYIGAWKNKGLIFFTIGQSEKSANSFYHVLNLDPQLGEVWLDIGMIFFEMGKIRESKLCYEKALRIRPGNLEEISSYTREFLHKKPYYQDIFDKYLSMVSSEDLNTDIEESEIITKILQKLI